MRCSLGRISSLFLYGVAIYVLKVLYENESYPHYTHKCGCSRRYFYPPLGPNRKMYNSSCSDEGTFYQGGQNVVSFSMFVSPEDDADRYEFYLKSLRKNLKKIQKFYPGYSVRVYTDEPLNDKFCKLVCDNDNRELFWCDVTKSPSLGNQTGILFSSWRFLPLGDPTVDTFLSRDLDAVITKREVAVVQDWLQLDKAIHLMRDKYGAHNFPILAGLWGARNPLLGADAPKLREKIIKFSVGISHNHKWADKEILNRVIFYPRKKDIVAYDSYHCKEWSNFTLVRPFPIKRKNSVNDFVGNGRLGKSKHELYVCPEECRPDFGKDWKYC